MNRVQYPWRDRAVSLARESVGPLENSEKIDDDIILSIENLIASALLAHNRIADDNSFAHDPAKIADIISEAARKIDEMC